MKPSEQIIETLSSIIPNPKIAFMPYKVAMWDSMEPVYLECKGKYRADLIPLDYMTFPGKKYHNESADFEELGYDTFGFKQISEEYYDFIVIHYPYDGCNNVTQLMPYEFVGALKKHAKVVYIPYHGNIAGREWKRFFTMPGARESDFICLGSDLDVEVFREVNPGYMGKIIRTSDSVKVECAEMHKEDPVPGKFANIEEPITLICGTLWTFTHDPEGRMEKHLKMLEKTMKTGNFVIYRPHPLVEDAIAVMRPDFLSKYRDFLKKVDEMVYLDTSPFLHQAIRAADRLICDPSSVLKTWQGTGKPYEVME